MFVEYIRRGDSTELLACSDNKEKLQSKLREDVKDFIEGVYGENWQEEADWLVHPENVTTSWSDEDEEYETVFQIVEVKEI